MASTLETVLLAQLNYLQNNTLQLISKQVLVSSLASVSFPSIPQTFDNLRLVVSAKSDGTTVAGYDSANLRFNGVSTASYNWNSWFTTQGASTMTVAGATSATGMQCAEIWNSHFASAGRGIAVIDIPNYSDANNFKIIKSESSATDGGAVGIQQTYTGCLNGATTAITSLTLLMNVGNFIADSTFTLYGY